MGPGPTEIHPRVLTTMSQPAIGYLDPVFVEMMEELKSLLRYVYQTDNALTFPVSGPGSVGMEYCFVNMVAPGDKVIVCQNGVFGGRMLENVVRCGGTAVVVEDKWGEPVDPQKVEDALKKNKDAKIVAFVHAETSTGCQSDAKTLTQIAHKHGALFMTDGTQAVGAIDPEDVRLEADRALRLHDRVEHGARRGEGLLRELVRQVELAHRDLDFHSRIGVMPEHFRNPADGLRVPAGLHDELHRDHLAGLRLRRLGRRDHDVVGDAPVFGHQKQHAVLRMQPPDDAAACPLQHFDDAALGAAAVVAAAHAHRDAIAVDHLAHLGRRDEHRRTAVVGHQEPVPVRMPFDAPGHQGNSLGDQQAAGAVLHQLARALELAQARVERTALASLDLQARGELVGGKRGAGAIQRLENFPSVVADRCRTLSAKTSPKGCFSGFLL